MRIAVVIPSFRVRRHILDVIRTVPAMVERIYVVDDCCPEGTADHVAQGNRDPRVRVVRNGTNLGVGGATMEGYKAALRDGFDIIVKMDGDGQMDGDALPRLVRPILQGDADYTKGNRFFDLSAINRMPTVRILGNAGLSFLSKISTGYWQLFDPTNGFTAIHAGVAAQLPMEKISSRYFFETDMLFRLNTIRAVVVDVPMDARYGDEESGLNVASAVPSFLARHVRNTFKRIFYNYVLRDLSLASLELVLGLAFLCAGTALGLYFWFQSFATGVASTPGSVMLAALQVIVGIQLLIGFSAYDIASVPRRPIHDLLPARETLDD